MPKNLTMYSFEDTEVRWGVIGAGDVCRVKSAPAMNKIPGSRIVAVMRRNAAKAREYAMEHGIPQWYDRAESLLADSQVNAVYIATPPDSHRELTLLAAKSQKPVYVEKPMARTWKECNEMIAACNKANVPLFVAYYRRMLPNYLKIKELVNDGTIGEIRHVRITMNKAIHPDIDRDPENWRVNPDIAGGGYFYDLASHQLDFLDDLFGPITDATGFSSNQAGLYPAEDLVTGTFRFSSGVQGTGTWCFSTHSQLKTDETLITGSKGSISYPTFDGYYFDLIAESPGVPQAQSPGVLHAQSPGVLHAQSPDGPQTQSPGVLHTQSPDGPYAASPDPGNRPLRFSFEMPEHIQQPLIETIVGQLLKKTDEKGNPVICPSTGNSAARTNRVMEQIAGS